MSKLTKNENTAFLLPMHKNCLLIFGTALILFTIFMIWEGLPELSLASTGLRAILFTIGLITGSAAFLVHCELKYDNHPSSRRMVKALVYPTVVLMILSVSTTIFYMIASTSGTFVDYQAKRYASLIGEVAEKDSQVLPALDIEKLALVPHDIALNRAMKKLSEQSVATIGSQYTVGRLVKQTVNGELRWVGFLEPRGFMRWFLEDGSPGYVSVSAVDENDAILVTEINGKPLNLKRGKDFHFFEQVDYAFWYHVKGLEYLTEAVPEVDDSGKPFWISSIASREVSNDGLVITGILVMDAQTGEIVQYAKNEAPAWVDRVMFFGIVQTNLKNYGEYLQGSWNFANQGKLSFENIDLVYDIDGSAHYIASVAAYGSNSTGIFAFMTVDARTGEVSSYPYTAVEEGETRRAILGSLPKGQLDFAITNIHPYLVNGIPTYVGMAYTGVGANKHYAFAAINNPQRLAVRTSVQAAYQAYLALPTDAPKLAINQGIQDEKVTSVVQRIAPVGTGYQVLLQGDDTIYTANAEILIELGLTQPGDKVTVRVTKGNANQGAILELDNLEFGPKAQENTPNSQS